MGRELLGWWTSLASDHHRLVLVHPTVGFCAENASYEHLSVPECQEYLDVSSIDRSSGPRGDCRVSMHAPTDFTNPAPHTARWCIRGSLFSWYLSFPTHSSILARDSQIPPLPGKPGRATAITSICCWDVNRGVRGDGTHAYFRFVLILVLFIAFLRSLIDRKRHPHPSLPSKSTSHPWYILPSALRCSLSLRRGSPPGPPKSRPYSLSPRNLPFYSRDCSSPNASFRGSDQYTGIGG